MHVCFLYFLMSSISLVTVINMWLAQKILSISVAKTWLNDPFININTKNLSLRKNPGSEYINIQCLHPHQSNKSQISVFVLRRSSESRWPTAESRNHLHICKAGSMFLTVLWSDLKTTRQTFALILNQHHYPETFIYSFPVFSPIKADPVAELLHFIKTQLSSSQHLYSIITPFPVPGCLFLRVSDTISLSGARSEVSCVLHMLHVYLSCILQGFGTRR